MHQPAGDRNARGDCGYRDWIGGRDDRGKRECDRERHRRDEPIDEVPNPHNGEDDEAKRQFQDRPLVAKQPFLWNAPAIQKQQRRQKQQKENIRF